MTGNKRFTIDVEEETQENALFFGDDFVCFSDDIDEYLELLNELNDENQILKVSNEEYEDALGRLEEENNDLKNNLCVFTELNRPLGTIIEENRHLKAFIKQLTNNCGEIVLMNGNAYDVKKILGEVE